MQRFTVGVCVAVWLWLGSTQAQASLLYSSTSNNTNNNTLHLVDQSTGQPSTIGLIGLNGARDLASDTRAASPRLWASTTDTGGDLYLVNPGGGSTLVGHMNTASNMRTLAFDVTTGRMFGTTYAKELYQIDPATAAVTLIGPLTNINGNDFDSLAFDAQGTLWTTTVSAPNAQLYTVNTSTAAATFKVSTTHLGFFSDIAFRPEDGVLFGISNTSDQGQLYTINTSTGVATAIGPVPHYDGTGLSFLPVPEPASIATLGVIAAVFLSRRHHKQITK